MSSGCDHANCQCLVRPLPLQQSLDEVDFERGLWGYILRQPSAEQVRTFIGKHGASCVDKPDKSGYTPLLYAARQGDVAICEVLLKFGADPNSATPGLRQTSLHRAAAQGHAHVVKLLLMYHAVADVKDANGKTPAFYAADKYPQITDMLDAACANNTSS